MLKNKYIAISGNIGTGKSTLVKFLSMYFNGTPFYEENVKNPYLENFYKNMSTWAFHSQIFFLINKFNTCKQLKQYNLSFLDRTIYEDAEIFADLLYDDKKINKNDYKTYCLLYEVICKTLSPPDLMVYLRCSIPILKRRILMRSNNEQIIETSYLCKLQLLYDSWIERYSGSKILIINSDKIDYNVKSAYFTNILKSIENLI